LKGKADGAPTAPAPDMDDPEIKDCRAKFNDWVKTFPAEGPPPSLEPFEPYVPRTVFTP